MNIATPKRRRKWKHPDHELAILQDCRVRLDKERLLEETNRDYLLQKLKGWKSRPVYEEVSGCSPETPYYWRNFVYWKFDADGLMGYQWVEPGQGERWKLVVPRALCTEILWVIHDAPTGGHLGKKPCLHTLRRLPIFWYEMKGDLQYHCRM
jgi:hypothetical protein